MRTVVAVSHSAHAFAFSSAFQKVRTGAHDILVRAVSRWIGHGGRLYCHFSIDISVTGAPYSPKLESYEPTAQITVRM